MPTAAAPLPGTVARTTSSRSQQHAGHGEQRRDARPEHQHEGQCGDGQAETEVGRCGPSCRARGTTKRNIRAATATTMAAIDQELHDAVVRAVGAVAEGAEGGERERADARWLRPPASRGPGCCGSEVTGCAGHDDLLGWELLTTRACGDTTRQRVALYGENRLTPVGDGTRHPREGPVRRAGVLPCSCAMGLEGLAQPVRRRAARRGHRGRPGRRGAALGRRR